MLFSRPVRVVRLMRSMLMALAVQACLLPFASAAQASPINGKDFVFLNPAQPAEPGQKVEVIEFFAYYCPHCNALDQSLEEWVKKQGDNIIFKRVHTSVTGAPMPQQRLFYALQFMGDEEKFHGKILYAIHVRHMRLDEDDEIIDFMTQQGIDRQKFTAIYRSFAVQSKVNQALQMQASYKIASWPTIVLDGKMATSPTLAGSSMNPHDERGAQNLMFGVMDDLVVGLTKERSK